MTADMRPLCKGGSSFNGSCRNCRTIMQMERPRLEKERQLRQLLRGPTDNLLSIVPLLPGLPEQHVPDAIEILTRHDVDASIAIKPETREFLLKQWDSVKLLPHDRQCSSPAIAAIVLESPTRVFELFNREFVGDGLLKWVLSLARFISTERTELGGTIQFDGLTPEDLYLGKRYCTAINSSSWTKERKRAHIAAGLRRLGNLEDRTQWTFDEVIARLAGTKYDEWTANEFRVSGLQPRIAELAFASLYPTITGRSAVGLTDMNVAALKADEDSMLPAFDWLGGRDKYDVKSNLFYGSSKDKVGLSGFIVNIGQERQEGTILPGIIFHDASSAECSWSYVGNLRPEHVPPDLSTGKREDRVAPFLFEMPDMFRLHEKPANNSVDILTAIATEFWSEASTVRGDDGRCHPLVPWLQSGRQIAPAAISELHGRMAQCIYDARKEIDSVLGPESAALIEQTVWRAVTYSVFKLRSAPLNLSKQEVNKVLSGFAKLFSSKSFPVKLAIIGQTTTRAYSVASQTRQVPEIDQGVLLVRWVEKVLRPLNENMMCPLCKEKERITILPKRMNAVGTITGEFVCGNSECGYRHNGTLLARCVKCLYFPLMLGKHGACSDCGKLRCEHIKDETNYSSSTFREQTTSICDACSATCKTKRIPMTDDEKPGDYWRPDLREGNRFRFIDPGAIPGRYIDIPSYLISKERVRAEKSRRGWEWAWDEL